jgi:multiple sugar transport system permease protein
MATKTINNVIETYPELKSVSTTAGIALSMEDAGNTVERIQKAEKVKDIVSTIFLYVIIAFLALLMIFPFYWMIITSLKNNDEIRSATQTLYPNIIMWSNYLYVFQYFKFGNYLFNTVMVAIFSTIGTLITTVLGAFAFARLKFKGRDALFALFLMTMMIPGEMMVISNYITVASFGWIGTGQTRVDAYAAMIVPFWVSVFYIYLLRQNFKQIPNELYLAAKVDGKSDWSFLWKVMVPLAAPTLISITILKFMGTWNAYVWPKLVTNSPDFYLISNGLRGSAFTDADTGMTSYGYQMAATVLVTVPLFLLFVIFRKYIMRGVGRAGIKG